MLRWSTSKRQQNVEDDMLWAYSERTRPPCFDVTKHHTSLEGDGTLVRALLGSQTCCRLLIDHLTISCPARSDMTSPKAVELFVYRVWGIAWAPCLCSPLTGAPNSSTNGMLQC